MITDISEIKKEFRKLVKERKKSLTFEERKIKSDKIFDKIEKEDFFNKANIIFIYWSLDDEVITHDFILKWHEKKTFVLPRIKGDELELVEFKGIENMSKNTVYNIFEPQGDIFNNYDKIDLAIVPGVAFDKNNNRLGRGKAFYDKILTKIKCKKIGICFDFQFFDEIPSDGHDIKMDRVITN